MKIRNLLILGVVICVICLSGCNEDDPAPEPVVPTGYSQGVFVVNEGAFQTGTGTITYLNRDGSDLLGKIYQQANNDEPLGNIAQSMNLEPSEKTDAYIAVNNADKIEVVNISTFEKVNTFSNITTPRYMEFGGNDKLYVSSWDNTVKVLSTVGYEFIGQIQVGTGPEKMLKVGNTIWVLNQGGFSVDSTISIIGTETDEVIETLQVYAKPTGIQRDENGLVWVLCSGNGWNGFPAPGDTEAHLICINPEDYSIIKDFAFPSTSEHPEKLVINQEGDLLFYNFIDGIYRMDIHNNELETTAFIPRSTMFYGLGLDRKSNTLYASDPIDFVQNGTVYRYNAFSGDEIDFFQAGIVPGEFFFTE